MDSSISVGQIVLSKSGRDKGRYFFIVKVLDADYIYLADGDLRKIESPKKKKIKHVKLTDYKDERLNKIISENKKVTNALLKRSLNSLGLIMNKEE